MILSKKIVSTTSFPIIIAIALGGSVLLALSARLSFPLPFSPVPITGQTLAVLLLGTLLGSRIGVLSVTIYLLEGLSGLPVFAAGATGPLYLLGPTGGYLIGFIPAVFLVGYLLEKGWNKNIYSIITTMILGTAVIYVFGVSWLSFSAGLQKALVIGFYPYLPGAVVKIILASLVVLIIHKSR